LGSTQTSNSVVSGNTALIQSNAITSGIPILISNPNVDPKGPVSNVVLGTKNSECFYSEFPGVKLVNDTFCLKGMYCPNLNVNDPTTIPVKCIASPECELRRLTGLPCNDTEHHQGRQGTYEPVICPRGHYCPTPQELYMWYYLTYLVLKDISVQLEHLNQSSVIFFPFATKTNSVKNH
jgi:hypothetical protein